MKKTLIALMALAGLASADLITTWDSTESGKSITVSGKDTAGWDVSTSGLTWQWAVSESIVWTMDMSNYSKNDSYTLLSIQDISYNGLSNVYISNGTLGLHRWNTNAPSDSVSLSNIIDSSTKDLTFVWTRVKGTGTSSGNTSGHDITLSVYVNDSFETAAATLTYDGDFVFGGKTFTTLYFGGNPGTILGDGESLIPDGDNAAEWNLVGAGFMAPQADGTLLSASDLKSYYSAVIPEPTTATLSLLALAGLAARRRRASR